MQLWMHRTYECAAPGANIPVPSTNPPKKKTLFEAVAVMLQKDVDGGDAFVAGHICHILLPEDWKPTGLARQEVFLVVCKYWICFRLYVHLQNTQRLQAASTLNSNLMQLDLSLKNHTGSYNSTHCTCHASPHIHCGVHIAGTMLHFLRALQAFQGPQGISIIKQLHRPEEWFHCTPCINTPKQVELVGSFEAVKSEESQGCTYWAVRNTLPPHLGSW